MIRREFITLLGGAAALADRGARAADGKTADDRFLGCGLGCDLEAVAGCLCAAAARTRLGRGSHNYGRTSLGGGPRRAVRGDPAEFIRLNVTVIVTAGIAVPAAKRATSAIPIVFTLSPDPVRSGLVASLARPGGNVTGLSNQSGDLVGKRLELLREVVPGLRRLAIMANGDNPQSVLELGDAQAEARKLGLDATTWKVRGAEDIAPVIETLKGHAEALYVVSDALATTNQVRINTFALSARLATMHANREYIETGGLISYGANYPDLFRRAGNYVDKILRGAKPADLPIEQPTKFDLVINLKTAKALGLEMPPTLIARADEVIE